MGAILTALGTMGAIVALGWVLGRRGTLGPAAPAVLARVVFAVATPCLLLVTVANADLHLLLSRTALVTALSTTTVVLVAVAVLRGLWRRSAADVTVAALASSYVNAGNLGLPLAVYLLGDAVAVVPSLLYQLLVLAPVAFAVLDARAPGAAGPDPTPGPPSSDDATRPPSTPAAPAATPDLPAVPPVPPDTPPTAAPLPGVGRGPHRGARMLRTVLSRTLRNPIIVGALAGLALAALPWTPPEVLLGPFGLIGAAAAPLALLTFGMSLAVPRTVDARPVRRELVLVVVLRSLVHPLLAGGIGAALGLEGAALLAVTAMAALPTAQNVLVYAIQYGRQQPLARDAGLVTTVLAVPVLLVVTALLG
ncbi:AEC family transporter [Cellulomonas sp. NS3]|uniref:AEC family transporter n=1 Tax=Cellulomonas sp. NS3 TaxID=2973977 RepID=UPI00216344DE|nr:AEC family transporter [Cellulomonas sp. NS3]